MKTTLETIVAEARELFRLRGYAGMSMQDLAERVGLKKPSLYTRFDSKEALVPEVLALTLKETLGDLPDPSRDWLAAYRTLIERIAETLTTTTRCVGGHLALGISPATPQAQAAVSAFFVSLRDGIAATLHPAMDEDAARLLATDSLTRLEGASVWLAATGDATPMSEAVSSLLGEAQVRATPAPPRPTEPRRPRNRKADNQTFRRSAS